jgi:hypothetical protein
MRLAFVLILSASPALAFEPGAHGEPTEETGYFAGCAAPEEGGSCVVHARGAVWVAGPDAPSEPAAIAVLQAMKPGDPVTFTGDMLSMGDITVELALNSAAPNPSDPLAPLVAGLQGVWSNDGQEVTITGLEWMAIDEADYLISLGTACSDGVERGSQHLILNEMGGDPFSSTCFEVISQDPNRIVLREAVEGAEVVLTR